MNKPQKEWEERFDTLLVSTKKTNQKQDCRLCDMCKEDIRDFIRQILAQARHETYEASMGVSQWREHGKKYTYWEFWEQDIKKDMGERS